MKIKKRTETLTIDGTPLQTGSKIPSFHLYNRDGEKIESDALKSGKVLISIYPDINTSVCDLQTRTLFEKANKLGNVKVINVSNNSIEELNDWCASAGLDVEMYSDKDLSFAKAMNLYIPEIDHLARSLYILEDGIITYHEIVADLATEPDYESALKNL